MKKIFETHGTCAKAIELDIDEQTGIIRDVTFIGGCPGNTLGISTLVRGMKAQDIVTKLEGLTCGTKRTSCPDQLARALREML